MIDECTDRPLRAGGAHPARRPAPGRLPAAAHPGAAARRRRHHRGAGAGGGGQPARPGSSTPCCAGWASATRRRGCSSSRRTPWRTRWATRRSPTPTRGGSRRPSPTRSGGDGRARRGARRRRRPPHRAPARPAGRDHGRGAGPRRPAAAEAPYSPYGVHLEPGSGDSGELDAVAEGLADRAGRGQPAGGARPHPGAADRRGHRPLARPVRGPRRQGGAARLVARHRRRQARRRGAQRAPRRPRAPRRRRPARWTCTPPTAARPRCPRAPTTGCWWTRRAPASGRCDGGPRPAGAVAPTTWRRWPSCSASSSRPRCGTCAPAAWSPTSRARRTSPRPTACCAAVLRKHRDVEQLDARPLLPGVPHLGDGPDACSCGRTATAPTRCSSACCGGRARSLLACLR